MKFRNLFTLGLMSVLVMGCRGGFRSDSVSALGSLGQAPPSEPAPKSLVSQTSDLDFNYLGNWYYPDCFSFLNRGPIQQWTLDYKRVHSEPLQQDISLRAYVHFPPGFDVQSGQKLPVIAMFHGGGWAAGSPVYWFPPALYFAARGAITISFQYRLSIVHGASPYDSTADAISAIRWIRKNASKLGVDVNHIVTVGDSAGGHLSLATDLLGSMGTDEVGDDAAISSRPQMVFGFYPLTYTNNMEAVDSGGYLLHPPSFFSYPRISPIDALTSQPWNQTPIRILTGEADHLPWTALTREREFCDRVNSVTGSDVCQITSYPGMDHAFLGMPGGLGLAAQAQMDNYMIGAGILAGDTAQTLNWISSAESLCQMQNAPLGKWAKYYDYDYPLDANGQIDGAAARAQHKGVWLDD